MVIKVSTAKNDERT